MINIIDAIVSPLKGAGETIQEAVKLRDAIKFGDTIGKLQAQILAAQQGAITAQQEQSAMSDRIRALETEVAAFKAHERQKHRYHLKDFGGGTFAYELRESEADGEPIHRICPACFQNGQTQILQSRGVNAFKQEMFRCSGCGHTLELGIKQVPNPPQKPNWRGRI